jgi:hypothetical protein
MRLLGRRGLSVVVLAWFGLAVAAAVPAGSAGSIPLARDYLLDGPRLAGGQVLYMTRWREDGYALWAGGGDAPPRVVATGRAAGRAVYRGYSFDAAAGRIGVLGSGIWRESDSGLSDPSAGVTVDYHDSRLLVGEVPWEVRPVARCVGAGTSFPYAVGESFVAFVDDCLESDVDEVGSPHLGYVDFSGGTPRRRRVTLANGLFPNDDYNYSLQVAGRWAAVDATFFEADGERTPALVMDLAAGGVAYRVERDGPMSFSLDADGTLVTVSGGTTNCADTLAFHTPSEPGRHPLPGEACRHAVEVDAGRFLFVGRAGGGPSLMLGRLDGSAPRPLVRLYHDDLAGFDIEGGQVVYGLGTCGGATAIRLASVEESDFRPRADRRCPVRVASRRARMRPGGRVAVRLGCPRGCAVSAELLLESRGPRRRRPIFTTSVESQGPTARLPFRIPRSTRARLPSGTTRARLVLFSRNLGRLRDTIVRSPIRLRVP